jgi:hypothetical protein
MFRKTLLALTASLALGAASSAHAHEKPENLKVLNKDMTEKDLEGGMKLWNKGLGTKCEACHVKGKMAKDDVKEKDLSREFLKKVVGNPDAAERKAALAELLKALKIETPKDEAKIWEGMAKFKK